MDSLIFSSVENIPGVNARAAFTVNSAAVFREDCDIMPSTFGNIKYMPWGADNQMPYDIIDLIERDETLATCQVFNAEICYGSWSSAFSSDMSFCRSVINYLPISKCCISGGVGVRSK